MKPAEQTQINFIADLLREGKQPKEILADFGRKWRNVSKRTFERRLKQAGEVLAEEQKRVKCLAEEQVQKEAAELKTKIMTSLERQAYLSAIIKGEVEIPYKEVKWNPDEKKFQTVSFVELAPHNARIAAIAELNRMDGSHAAQKIDATVGVGVKQIIIEPASKTKHK